MTHCRAFFWSDVGQVVHGFPIQRSSHDTARSSDESFCINLVFGHPDYESHFVCSPTYEVKDFGAINFRFPFGPIGAKVHSLPNQEILPR